MKMMIKSIAGISFFAMMLLIVFQACDQEENDLNDPVPAVIIEDSVIHVSTYGGNDGEIKITLKGGQEPFFVLWGNGETTTHIDSLSAGDYTVSISYGESAVSTKTFTVTEPGPYDLDIQYEVTDAQWYEGKNGSIKVTTIEGGIPPYSFLWQHQYWNPDDSIKTKNISGLYAGEYKLLVWDSNPYNPVRDSVIVTVDQPEFSCGSDSIRDVDNNKYPTVQIEDQCWISQNLKTTHRPDNYNAEITGKYCRELYCLNKEGAHYSWESALNGSEGAESDEAEIQGICPEGWHIPTLGEWEELDSILNIAGNYGEGFFSGQKLKGTNSSSGFNALLTGNWGYTVYENAGQASFWTSNAHPDKSARAYFKYLTEDTPFMNGGHVPKAYGLSVRCIKNGE